MEEIYLLFSDAKRFYRDETNKIQRLLILSIVLITLMIYGLHREIMSIKNGAAERTPTAPYEIEKREIMNHHRANHQQRF